MNQGPICAKVYPEGLQPIKGNNCGLIPNTDSLGDFTDVQPENYVSAGILGRELLASGLGFASPGTSNSASRDHCLKPTIFIWH